MEVGLPRATRGGGREETAGREQSPGGGRPRAGPGPPGADRSACGRCVQRGVWGCRTQGRQTAEGSPPRSARSRTPRRTSDPVGSKPRRLNRVPRDGPRTPRRTSARRDSHAGTGDRAYRASPDSGSLPARIRRHRTAGSRRGSASRPSPGGTAVPTLPRARPGRQTGSSGAEGVLCAVRVPSLRAASGLSCAVARLGSGRRPGRAPRPAEARASWSPTGQRRSPRMPSQEARPGGVDGELLP
jgi:hypothetical protein